MHQFTFRAERLMTLIASSRMRTCGMVPLVLLTVLTNGCMVGSDFKSPQARVATHWIDAPPAAMPNRVQRSIARPQIVAY
jgi:hypothetical protein